MYAGRVGYLGGWDHDAMRSSLPPEVWDPFYPFPAIQAEAYAEAAFEWRETAEAHVLTAHMPGARKVEVEAGGMLKVSGERRSEKFERRFRLPEDGRVAELKATMGKDGVLTVTVPNYKGKKSPPRPNVAPSLVIWHFYI